VTGTMGSRTMLALCLLIGCSSRNNLHQGSPSASASASASSRAGADQGLGGTSGSGTIPLDTRGRVCLTLGTAKPFAGPRSAERVPVTMALSPAGLRRATRLPRGKLAVAGEGAPVPAPGKAVGTRVAVAKPEAVATPEARVAQIAGTQLTPGVHNLDPALVAQLTARKDSLGKPSRFLNARFGPGREFQPGRSELVVQNGGEWVGKKSLNIHFLDENPPEAAIKAVKDAAAEWSACQAIQFTFDDAVPADIRVGLEEGSSSYSAVGMEATKVSADEPTMVLGILGNVSDSVRKRETLHEFGHALGLGHEHQSPSANIQWDKPAAYLYYNQLYGWLPERVDAEVLAPFSVNSAGFTVYDPASIMQYLIPGEITLNHFSHGYNLDLSEIDKCCINRWYPKFDPSECAVSCD